VINQLLPSKWPRPVPSGAATRKLAVDDHTRQASNSVLLCPNCNVSLMHVVNFDVVARARMRLTSSRLLHVAQPP